MFTVVKRSDGTTKRIARSWPHTGRRKKFCASYTLAEASKRTL